MTGRAMNELSRIINHLMGIKISSQTTTLSALTKSKMPDYDIELIPLMVGRTRRACHVYRVSKFCGVLESRIGRVIARNGFVPSSIITNLSDDTIIVKFGGDKGGRKMSSKLGAILLNQQSANEPEAFDFLGTMEAFGTYKNIYTAFFKNWKNEMNQLFPSILEADDLTVLVVSDSVNIPLLIKMSCHHVSY
jgi:hypothetical protein